jgi:hypothetical protein
VKAALSRLSYVLANSTRSAPSPDSKDLTLRVGGLSSLAPLPGELLTPPGYAEPPFFKVRLLPILAQSRRTESARHGTAAEVVLYFGMYIFLSAAERIGVE